MNADDAQVILRTFTAAAAASAALVDPVLGASAATAIPMLDELQSRWIRDRRSKAEETLTTALATSKLAPEAFVERITSTPALTLLLQEALTAASMTALDAKLRALGEGLAAGLLATDEGTVDSERVWVQVLSPIEAPHVRFLVALDRTQPDGADIFRWMYDHRRDAFAALGTNDKFVEAHILSTLEDARLVGWRFGDTYPASYGLDGGASAGDKFWYITTRGQAALAKLRERAE